MSDAKPCYRWDEDASGLCRICRQSWKHHPGSWEYDTREGRKRANRKAALDQRTTERNE